MIVRRAQAGEAASGDEASSRTRLMSQPGGKWWSCAQPPRGSGGRVDLDQHAARLDVREGYLLNFQRLVHRGDDGRTAVCHQRRARTMASGSSAIPSRSATMPPVWVKNASRSRGMEIMGAFLAG